MGAPPFLKQAWTVSAVLVNMFGQGFMLSYTTSLLPALQDPESPIKADLHTASWISSLVGMAGVPGFLISSFLMDIYGRKLAHLIVVLPAIAGWLAIYFAQNIPTIMVGRFLNGVTAGATVSLGAIVIGEYSTPKYRGVFLNLKTASVCLGGMCGHIVANFLTWRIVALIGTLPSIISAAIIVTWPESPAWLASRGEFEKSEKAFFWLRERSEASQKELNELFKAQKERLLHGEDKKTINDKVMEFFMKFTKKDFLKPVFIVLISVTILEASGRHIFPAYAVQIINEVTGSKSQSFYFTLGIDFIITSSAVCSSVLVKIMKRRTLLFSTGFAAVGILLVVCIYLALSANNIISNEYPWIPSSIFVVYFILANLGSTPIPLALLGEVFPLPHRGVGTALTGVWMSLCVMIALQITPHLLLHIKVYGTFFVYGITLGLMLFILYFILPETKDKTLQEIEDYFKYGVWKDDDRDEPEEVKAKMINYKADDVENERTEK